MMPKRTPLKTDDLPSFEDLINAADPRPEDAPEIDPTRAEQATPRTIRVTVDDPPPPDDDQKILQPDEIVPPERKLSHAVLDDDGSVNYQSRIRILDAWQYPGQVPASAPVWVDRNWIGWADSDGLRGVDAGPCLRVPIASGDLAVCRVGDYVARQEVLLMAGFPGDIRIEVWPQGQFEKLFLPLEREGA